MNIAWLETRRGDNNGHRSCNPELEVSAGLRYASRLGSIVGADMITDAFILRSNMGKKYDAIIVGYSTKYQEYKLETEFLKKNKDAKLFHISTEYENALPACLYYAGIPFTHIANYEKIPSQQVTGGWKLRNKFVHINLNIVHYIDAISKNKKNGTIYYGRFRADRLKYLKLLNGTDCVVSTAKDNMSEWLCNGLNGVKFVDKISWKKNKETLRLFLYSIYFEDKYTHNNYNCPANRWYESLSFDCQPIVHVSCMKTMERAGISIDRRMFFDDSDQLQNIISNRETFSALADWRELERDRCREEKKEFAERFKALIC